ncbi:phage tail assembly chaperone [Paenibacillus sp. GCM10012303]|uniref:phage tail assembly chaperone n=1 Tax=Paenibacillus sp. GCM10012303 TaxID=3317340 RepID=UPI00361CCE4A
MKPAESYKDVEINGRTFRIRKFDALTGSFMLVKVTGLIAPLFKNVDISKLKEVGEASEIDLGAFNVSGMIAEIGNLSESDFRYVQEKCLQVCGELLPAGVAPILNSNGTFGVAGLEEDTMTVLALTVHAILFNVKGFFAGSPLASLVGGLLNTSPRG